MTSVAIVHDILAARAGGERVLVAIADAFPSARIHTLVHEPTATFPELAGRHITSSTLGRSTWLRRNYRYTAPVAALTMASSRIDADVTICSTSGISHHVRVTGRKLVYCHTPARWLHDTDNYLQGFGRARQAVARTLAGVLRPIDRRAMRSADAILVNSATIAAEVDSAYGMSSRIVAPCSTLDLDGPVAPLPGFSDHDGGFVLSPVRALGYKRLDLLIAAARAMPEQRFVHVGDGPHRKALLADAPPNLRSFAGVEDAALRWAYRHAGVVALTCAEDFGLVPLEASAHGVHTVAPGARGLLDHGRSHMTLYPFGDIAALQAAIADAPPPTGRRDAERLGTKRFREQLLGAVADLAGSGTTLGTGRRSA